MIIWGIDVEKTDLVSKSLFRLPLFKEHKNKLMYVKEIATKEDIQQLSAELKELFNGVNNKDCFSKKWLKSSEVMKFLGVSASGLQNLRTNGTIPYYKLGGVIYYDYADLENVLKSTRRYNND